VCLPAAAGVAQEPRVSFAGHQLVRVNVQSEADLALLQTISPDLWTDYPGIGQIDARIPPERVDALKASGLSYVVLDDDIGPETSRHLNRSPFRGAFDDYMTLDEIVQYLDTLIAARPDLCERFSIGQSVQTRPLWVLHITGPGSGPKPAVFYHAGIHAREWITEPVVLYLANYLVTNYDTDPAVQNLVDTLDIYLAPCVNPDGYTYCWNTYRLWRKNRRNNGDGSYGVDLNRNFAYGWGGGGSSGTPSDETYRGPSAFSEPETQAIRDFIVGHPDILAYMDYHSYAQLIMWPYGYANVLPPEPDRTTFNTLGLEMKALIYAVHGVQYDQGPIYSTIYQASGGSVDWVYGAEGRFGFTIELRDTGQYGFELPPEQILPTCEENLPAILHLTQFAADQVGVHFSFPDGLPDVRPGGEPTAVQVEVTTSYDTLVPGSPTLHYRHDGGAFQAVPLVLVSGNLYEATLPPAACTDHPEFYFSAEGAGSGTAYIPAGAPSETFTALVGEFVMFFADNCETNLGWTVVNSTSPALTDGAWDRGVPVNCSRGDPPADYDGSGQCYLTDNSAANGCNSDVDGGYTWLVSPTFNLAGADATVSYAVWYTNNYGSAPNNDVFKVYVSADNGTNWTLVQTLGPATSSGWTVYEFRVTDFVIPSDRVKVRFEASDLGSGSVVEAGVDAIFVRQLECACSNPGDGNGDCIVDLADYVLFTDCLTGPGTFSVPPACAALNFDGDSDVDLQDCAEFQSVLDRT